MKYLILVLLLATSSLYSMRGRTREERRSAKPVNIELFLDVKIGRIERIREMLQLEVDMSPYLKGITLLHIAAREGHAEIVELLIEHDMLVDLCNNTKKKTPLHEACKHGHIGVAKVLLAKGADKSLQTKSGKIAHDYALKQGCQELIALVSER